MDTHATHEDANLILRLYELRREEKLRRARDWFGKSYKARTMEQHLALCPPGSEQDAYFRMVVGYWDMVGSFVTEGILNQNLFFQSGRELLFVWEKIRYIVPLWRDAAKDPHMMGNVEAVANSFIKWMQNRSPESYAAFSARVAG
jgi:hypothetical protein